VLLHGFFSLFKGVSADMVRAILSHYFHYFFLQTAMSIGRIEDETSDESVGLSRGG
jgi:hypothetical protein